MAHIQAIGPQLVRCSEFGSPLPVVRPLERLEYYAASPATSMEQFDHADRVAASADVPRIWYSHRHAQRIGGVRGHHWDPGTNERTCRCPCHHGDTAVSKPNHLVYPRSDDHLARSGRLRKCAIIARCRAISGGPESRRRRAAPLANQSRAGILLVLRDFSGS
jgi:hypothetical protein